MLEILEKKIKINMKILLTLLCFTKCDIPISRNQYR